MTYHAKVIAGGKIVIPSELRREFGIKDGDSLVVERDSSGAIVIRTYAQVVRDVRLRFRELRAEAGEGDTAPCSAIDELLTERRDAARRESADAEAWIATTP